LSSTRPPSPVARMIQSAAALACLTTGVSPPASTTRSSRLPERPSVAAGGSRRTAPASIEVTAGRLPGSAIDQGIVAGPVAAGLQAGGGQTSSSSVGFCMYHSR
jgi:hypothetical protein